MQLQMIDPFCSQLLKPSIRTAKKFYEEQRFEKAATAYQLALDGPYFYLLFFFLFSNANCFVSQHGAVAPTVPSRLAMSPFVENTRLTPEDERALIANHLLLLPSLTPLLSPRRLLRFNAAANLRCQRAGRFRSCEIRV